MNEPETAMTAKEKRRQKLSKDTFSAIASIATARSVQINHRRKVKSEVKNETEKVTENTQTSATDNS